MISIKYIIAFSLCVFVEHLTSGDVKLNSHQHPTPIATYIINSNRIGFHAEKINWKAFLYLSFFRSQSHLLYKRDLVCLTNLKSYIKFRSHRVRIRNDEVEMWMRLVYSLQLRTVCVCVELSVNNHLLSVDENEGVMRALTEW